MQNTSKRNFLRVQPYFIHYVKSVYELFRYWKIFVLKNSSYENPQSSEDYSISFFSALFFFFLIANTSFLHILSQCSASTPCNDTHREQLCFTQFSTRMAGWLFLTFFIYLHNQLSSTHSIITYKEYRCLKNVIHQTDSKSKWSLLSASFGLDFVLTLENAFP